MNEPGFLSATRDSYDAVAADYAEKFRDELAATPIERGLLAAFAEEAVGAVLDVGAGPGGVTAYLHGLGADVSGLDLSPRMVELARRAHPGVRFEVGSMTAIARGDRSLGGLVAWYSIIHVPDERLPEVFAEFRRVLAPGGRVALAFQVGDTTRHLTEAFGRDISLSTRLRPVERVAGLLDAAGLPVDVRMVRSPEGVAPRACLMGRRVE
ncbi:class I SAM-dependent DNA methyltransferase [Nonomuraea soli]|uniref:Trans-aconitate methyltransferase n=1 Tax=Nonomuraea soli TaxID=1032476 RepID=A0A7W0CJL6_9ACTN|nr:class I SAM-dependent methyltransferase [Nonomuraea soli]MBA2892414.1 trans-aconitate methyltransferase [Nonomuraea soli]